MKHLESAELLWVQVFLPKIVHCFEVKTVDDLIYWFQQTKRRHPDLSPVLSHYLPKTDLPVLYRDHVGQDFKEKTLKKLKRKYFLSKIFSLCFRGMVR